MDYTLFFALLNLILVGRLRLTFRDRGAGPADMVVMGLIPMLILPFLHINNAWFILLAYLLMVPVLTFIAERGGDRLNRNRGLMLLLHIVAAACFASGISDLRTGMILHEAEHLLGEFMLPDTAGGTINWLRIHAFIFGLLLIMNEMNLIIRYLMELMNLKQNSPAPAGGTAERQKDKQMDTGTGSTMASGTGMGTGMRTGTTTTTGKETGNGGPEDIRSVEQQTDRFMDPVDEQDYNTGRVIGLLERIFIYILILAGQFTAVGFVLTAKGIIRYPELKNKTFAEYVLIGTLMSSLSALIIAYFVRYF